MSGSSIRVPSPTTPIVDKSGTMTVVARQFFAGVLNRVGGSTGAVAALNGNANEEFAVADAKETFDAVPLAQAQTLFGVTASPGAASVVTVGASPFSYTATAAGVLVVDGGTVSAVSLARGSVSATAPITGLFPLRNGDTVKVTYTAAPTLTWFPN